MASLSALILIAIKASIFLNVLALGMSARPTDALYVLRRPALLLRSLLAMYVIMPLFAAALAVAFDLRPVVKVVLVALALAPVPPLLPKKQMKAGGHASYTIGLLAAASLLAIVVVPVVLTVLGRAFGWETHVPVATIASIVATSVLAPMALGLLIRHFAPGGAERCAKPVAIASAVVLVVGAVPILLAAWPAVVALIGNGTLLVLGIFTAVGLAVGHWLGGSEPDERTVVALSTACRHPAIAMAIATANFTERTAVMGAVLLYLIVSALVSLPYVRRQTRRGGGVGGAVEVRPSVYEHALTIKRSAL
jgi:bile acid:Na+ symporter, BASS family